MAIHPKFPTSPHEILKPEYRWFPADEALRETSYEKLFPPFVHKIRKEVEEWRNNGYPEASETSRALLEWWFCTQHIITKADGTLVEFKYYFAQREAIETVVYLYEVARVKDKYDLIRYDSSGAVSTGMFDEEWLRLVIKMATGSGKTKVMSLIVTWCYFHKLYEEYSQLASNFLLIAPNIIVLDRLRTDFDGLRIFFSDPLLNPASFGNKTIEYQTFTDEEMREIVFKDITTGEITHTTKLDSSAVTDYRSVIGYFTQTIMKDLRLVSGYDVLYGKVKEFISLHLFAKDIEIENLNTLRNLSELEACKTIIETFKKKINELTVQDKGSAEIRDYIKLRQTRPFVVKDQGFLVPQKSVFNRIIGDSNLELLFASFLEKCPDVVSYSKNFLAVHFNLDYVNADGNISNYYPDFLVKTDDNNIYIVETKGNEDLDVPLKTERLKEWCKDINANQKKHHFDFVFVEEEDFEKYKPDSFAELVKNFRRYKDE